MYLVVMVLALNLWPAAVCTLLASKRNACLMLSDLLGGIVIRTVRSLFCWALSLEVAFHSVSALLGP